MTPTEWQAVLIDLHVDDDPDRFAKAATRLHERATVEDIPRLRELLADTSFAVREAAAWPLTELAGVEHLPDLLKAYQRGLEDGQDNDSFSAALIDLAEAEPIQVSRVLESLVCSGDRDMQENARWLLGFCAPAPDA